MSSEIYYRPPWTCGKYCSDNHVALMVNLTANCDYFFEGDSADVIGMLLKVKHGESIGVEGISKILDISKSSIIPFFDQLTKCGLLSNKLLSDKDVLLYRKSCIEKSAMIRQDFEGTKIEANKTPESLYITSANNITIPVAMFELTYRCSEKCLHCYNPGATRNDKELNGRAKVSEMSLEDYYHVIDDFSAAGLIRLDVSGGDPFSNNNVWEILEYLRKKEIEVTLLTNGQSIVNNVDRLAALYPRQVRLSLYSQDPAVHDSITRVKGSWEKTMAVVKRLRELSVPVGLACVVMQPNFKTCLGVRDIGEKYGCEVDYDVCITDGIDGDIAPRGLRLNQRQYEILFMDDYISSASLRRILPKTDPIEGQPCGAGVNTFCVAPNGDLMPCANFHLILGNLKKDNLLNIIQNSEKLKCLRESKSSQYEECWTHDYCEYCNFCVGNNYTENHSPYKACKNACNIAKIHYDLAHKIQKGVDVLNGMTVRECVEKQPDFIPFEMHKIINNRENETPASSLSS